MAQSLRRCSLVDNSRSAGVVGGFGGALGALPSFFGEGGVAEGGGFRERC